MKLILIALVVVLIGVIGFTWGGDDSDQHSAFFQPRERKATVVTPSESQPVSVEAKQAETKSETLPTETQPSPSPRDSLSKNEDESFPEPTVQIVNGRPERTIHMGVRQYAWDPSVIQAKQGELVRLIIHNADVQHGLVIPELNVLNIDIPTEGAVIEFEANKVGTFVFFCSYYCGEGHSEMRGKIIIE